MLTNEQCIEIAEKVWGWSIVQVKGTTDLWHIDLSDDMYDIHAIKNKVNSWQGFGRTVEAMEKMETNFSRGFVFTADGLEVEFSRCIGQKGEEDHYEPIHESESHLYYEIRELIKATHLAALEAINESKSS